MNLAFETATIAEIVASDGRAADVLEAFGIDACSSGRRAFLDACRSACADSAAVERALSALPPQAGEDDVRSLGPSGLIDHILGVHHAYLHATLPAIERQLAALVAQHGARHPELARVSALFEQLSRELRRHLVKEEQVLFPYIRDLASQPPNGGSPSPFGTVENPIRMMEREHGEVGGELRLIRQLTQRYTPPPDACSTWRACYDELARLERDLQRHVHLEDNVLFPAAIELEQA